MAVTRAARLGSAPPVRCLWCRQTTRWSRALVMPTYSRRCCSRTSRRASRRPACSKPEVRRGPHADLRDPVFGPDHRRRAGPVGRVALQPGQDDDGEFEALGTVDRHHPHGVIVGVRGPDAPDATVALGPEVGPGEKGPQGPARRLVEEPGLVQQPPQPLPVVTGTAMRQSQCEAAQLPEGGDHHVRRFGPPPPPVQTVQHGHGLGHRVVLQARRYRCPRVPRTAGRVPGHQVVVPAGETRGPQGAQDGHRVGGVVGGPQHGQHFSGPPRRPREERHLRAGTAGPPPRRRLRARAGRTGRG